MTTRTVNGDPELFREFMSHDFDGPFTMLNMLKFAETASYEKDSEFEGSTGREAYARYLAGASKAIGHLGGEMIFKGSAFGFPICPPDEKWDEIFIIKWPSHNAFLGMIKDEDYQKITFHRTAALEDSRLIAIK